MIMFVLEKDRIFITSKESLITEDSGRAEVEKDNTIETLKCENEAHIVVLCTQQSIFLYDVGLINEAKESDFKDSTHNKRQTKFQV